MAKNEFRIRLDGVVEVKLTQGQVALVDFEDWEKVKRYRWRAHGNGKIYRYAASRIKGKETYMHRMILGAGPGEYVDHVNHNGLDNRRANIRLCTGTQNQGNRRKHKVGASRFKGVGWNEYAESWQARIQSRGVRVHLGFFSNEREAAAAYDRAALKLFGEFALPNGVTYP